MMKVCGAISILVAGGLLGGVPILRLLERIRVLALISEALSTMRAELNTYNMSIPELMRTVKDNRLFSSVVLLLEEEPMSFSAQWKTCVAQVGKNLTVREYRAVSSLGDVLGRYALEEQLASMDGVIELLREGKSETAHKLHSVSKLYVGTSLSLSAMLVVLLL